MKRIICQPRQTLCGMRTLLLILKRFRAQSMPFYSDICKIYFGKIATGTYAIDPLTPPMNPPCQDIQGLSDHEHIICGDDNETSYVKRKELTPTNAAKKRQEHLQITNAVSSLVNDIKEARMAQAGKKTQLEIVLCCVCAFLDFNERYRGVFSPDQNLKLKQLFSTQPGICIFYNSCNDEEKDIFVTAHSI
jgi:hypothetical protein